MDYKYQGIILNKKNVGETDRIYTIYTLEMGKIRVLAKSVRLPKAKLAGYLEPITRAEIFLAKTRGMGKITGSIVVNNFSQIKTDLDSMKQVFYVMKILEKIISEQDKDGRIFELLESYLEIMENLSSKEENENKKNILTLGFLFKFLGEMGYQIEVGNCVKCEKRLIPKENYFSARLGGTLCGECARNENQKMKIEDDSIKFIRIFLKNNISSLIKLNASKNDIDKTKLIFRDFLSWSFAESNLAGKVILW